MAQSKIHARFVQNSVGSFYVVYPTDADFSQVVAVATTMSRETGTRLAVALTYLDEEREKSPVIEMPLPQNEATLRRIKELADPELPVAIATMTIELIVCQCDRLSLQLPAMQFVDGFGPDDSQEFTLRYYAAVKKLPVVDLLMADLTPPYNPLTDGIEEMLGRLGARATSLQLELVPDQNPCTHK